MATADQVKALVRSHGEGDDARFYSVALTVACELAAKEAILSDQSHVTSASLVAALGERQNVVAGDR